MSSQRIQLFRYKLPLLETLPRQPQSARFAEGLIAVLRSQNGHMGYGELAKSSLLPHESLEEAEQQLARLLKNESDRAASIFAPVRWAFESANTTLLMNETGQSFAKMMNKEPTPVVILNALLDVGRSDLVDKGMRFFAEGYRTFKIKIGEGPLHLEISRIRELLAVLGNSVTLRLDANRTLELEQAVEMAHSLKRANIEYFEEPFADLDVIEKFHNLTGAKIALDESIVEPAFKKWCTHPAVCAYVIKPSRVGSVEGVKELIGCAYESGRYFVVTSTFESSIGLTGLAQIAALRQDRAVAMGLATNSYFATDFLSPPLRPFRGQLLLQNLGLGLESLNLEDSIVSQLVLEHRI